METSLKVFARSELAGKGKANSYGLYKHKAGFRKSNCQRVRTQGFDTRGKASGPLAKRFFIFIIVRAGS